MRTTAPYQHDVSVPWLRRRYLPLICAGLALAFVHPPGGLGVCVCLFRTATGIPCPGCGLTRSLSCTLHGEFAAAWSYHPFGPILAILLLLIAVAGLLPYTARARLAQALARRPRLVGGLYAILVGAFLLHGIARALVYALGAGRAALLLN